MVEVYMAPVDSHDEKTKERQLELKFPEPFEVRTYGYMKRLALDSGRIQHEDDFSQALFDSMKISLFNIETTTMFGKVLLINFVLVQEFTKKDFLQIHVQHSDCFEFLNSDNYVNISTTMNARRIGEMFSTLSQMFDDEYLSFYH